jgi:DNA-directed RNA polymerase specialized sigma24 family protein
MSDPAAPRLAAAGGEIGDAQSHFDSLLTRLGADGRSRGDVYEQLRRRLILMLRLHVPADAEALADIALDRLARRVHEGTPIDNPHLYALGIARNLVLEAQSRTAKQQRMGEDPTLLPEQTEDDTEAVESAHAAMAACLEQLGGHARDLLLAYYSADGAARIRTRQHLASELGLSINALRNRALRLRAAVSRCVHTRLHGSDVA